MAFALPVIKKRLAGPAHAASGPIRRFFVIMIHFFLHLVEAVIFSGDSPSLFIRPCTIVYNLCLRAFASDIFAYFSGRAQKGVFNRRICLLLQDDAVPFLSFDFLVKPLSVLMRRIRPVGKLFIIVGKLLDGQFSS